MENVGTARHPRPGLAEELPRRGLQDRERGHRGGLRPLHDGEEGYRDRVDQPACALLTLLRLHYIKSFVFGDGDLGVI